MSARIIRPSTLIGVKRYAKSIKISQGMMHAEALNAAAVAGGFQNYTHALRSLDGAVGPTPGHLAYISVPWRIRETKETGQEVLTIHLKQPLDSLVKPAHLKAARHFGAFKFAAPDHLCQERTSSSRSEARRSACAVARTVVFMEATGLRPSSGHSRAYPRGSFINAVPGNDHSSEWYDPTTKAYVFVDEPYSRALSGIAPDRLAWSEKYGWSIGLASWAGMYNPDGGCEMYLASDKTKGFNLKAALTALNALPPPVAEANWDGQSQTPFSTFESPAAEAKVLPNRPAKRGPTATVGYRTPLSGRDRRRPAAKMPIESHAEVGRHLKSVIFKVRNHNRVIDKCLNSVRCVLDNWVQCEYNRVELSDNVFFDLYYGEEKTLTDELIGETLTQRHVSNLLKARGVLAEHYPDCAPLRSLLKSIDGSISRLRVIPPPPLTVSRSCPKLVPVTPPRRA